MWSFEFWTRWLFYASLFFAGVGLVVATLGDTVIFDYYNTRLAEHFWGSSEIPTEANELRLFLFGPIGGTIAGSYILQAYIARGPFRRRERWAHQASIASLVTWFLIDSVISILHGAIFNVYLINIFALVGIGLPLVITRREFSDCRGVNADE